jgi:hypothetical protein
MALSQLDQRLEAFRCGRSRLLSTHLHGDVMGRKSKTGGVTVAGRERIQFDLKFGGVRYRPTLLRTPTKSNLRRAREHLVGIKERIVAGTFSFAEEFPAFLHLNKVPTRDARERALTCSTPFSRIAKHVWQRTIWPP